MAKAKKKESTLTLEEKLTQALVQESEQPYIVPKNWCWTKIGVVSKIVSKGTTPTGGKNAYVDEGISFVRVENINDDGTISHDNIVYIDKDVHEGGLKRSILFKDDVLVSIAGTLGKTAIVRDIDLPMNTNQALAFVRLYTEVAMPKYIMLLLNSPVFNNLLISKTKVTSIPNLTLDIVSNSFLPLPPLTEQQRIVERIESLFAKLDEAKDKLQEVLDGGESKKVDSVLGKIDLMKKSILARAFRGELGTNDENEESSVELLKTIL